VYVILGIGEIYTSDNIKMDLIEIGCEDMEKNAHILDCNIS
jgi:hypothetical protein